MIPLGLMREGERGVISEVKDEKLLHSLGSLEEVCSKGCLFCKKEASKIKSLGFMPGMAIRVIKNEPGHPLLVLLENTQIALSRSLAMKILVEKT